jgi:hypothetical protein
MRKFIFILVLAVAGCGGASKSGTGGNGAAGGSDAGSAGSGGSAGGGGATAKIDMNVGDGSACGHVGDKGNSKGIGQYCQTVNDCPTSAPICSSFENGLEPSTDQTFFCTTTCTGASDTTTCGTDANCICQSLGCACVPAYCGTTAPIVDMAQ